MKQTILALQPLLPDEMIELEEAFRVIKLWDSVMPDQTIMDHSHEITGVLSTYNCGGVSDRLITVLPNLEIIAQFGVGYDNIDVEAALARDIAVTNTPDVLTDDTADVALFLMLNVMRRAVEADMFVRVGRWQSASMPLSHSVSGKTVGIVGLGNIGQAIAKRVQAFNMNIVYHSRSQKDVSYSYYNNLVEMARDCDVLIVACAGGDDTRNLINYEVLEALGPQGYLINIARGSVVKEDDLLAALSNKAIAGAGLDVFENEPFVPDELFKMDNVVLSPHVGSATVETRSKMGHLVIENLKAHFLGQKLLTPISEMQ